MYVVFMKRNMLSNVWGQLDCRFNNRGFVAMRSMDQSSGGLDVEGSTGFFRDEKIQESLIGEVLSRTESSPVRILVVPGSIGCEALTLSMIAHAIDPSRNVQIDTFDVSDLYTDVAKLAVYPEQFKDNVPERYQKYFNANLNDGYIEIDEDVRSNVNILPAQSVFEFEPEEPYDLVVSMNFLMHLDAEQSVHALQKMSQLSSGMFTFNNFEELGIKKNDYNELNDYLVSSRSFSLLDRAFRKVSDDALPMYRSFVNIKDSFVDDEPFDYRWNLGDSLDCVITMSCD